MIGELKETEDQIEIERREKEVDLKIKMPNAPIDLQRKDDIDQIQIQILHQFLKLKEERKQDGTL